jgi:hypothetical protein
VTPDSLGRVNSRGLSPVRALVAVVTLFALVVGVAVVTTPARTRPKPTGTLAAVASPTTASANPSNAASASSEPSDAPRPSPSAAPAGTRLQRCSQVSRDADRQLVTSHDWTLRLDDRDDLAWQCVVHPNARIEDGEPIAVMTAHDYAVEAGLAVTWHGDPCASEVLIRLDRVGRRARARYVIDVAEVVGGIDCRPFAVQRRAVLFLRQAIDPEVVDVSLRRTNAPTSGMPGTSGRLVDCSLRAAVEVTDATGMVAACQPYDNGDRSSDLWLAPAGGGGRWLHVGWLGQSCGAETQIRVVPLGDTIGIAVQPTRRPHCESGPFPLGMTLVLSAPVDVETVQLSHSVRVLEGE